MKKTAALFSLLIAGMAASAAGQALTADYVGVIKIDTDQPLALAADASGALYVGIFGGTSGNNILRVADPVAVTEDPQDSTEWDALPRVGDVFATIDGVTWASGRGVQGLAVDSLGNVYVSGDNSGGTPSDGVIRKFDSTGNPDTTFNTAAAAPGFRGAGAALLNDGVMPTPCLVPSRFATQGTSPRSLKLLVVQASSVKRCTTPPTTSSTPSKMGVTALSLLPVSSRVAIAKTGKISDPYQYCNVGTDLIIKFLFADSLLSVYQKEVRGNKSLFIDRDCEGIT